MTTNFENVVGLDLSLTSTGVSRKYGTHSIRVKSKDCERLIELRKEVLGYCITASHVVIEGFSFGSPMQAHNVGGLGWIVRVGLFEAGIPYTVVPPSSLKKFATGKGNAKKDEILAAAVRAGAHVTGNDEADAWWLRQMGLMALAGEADVPRTEYRTEALAKVAWTTTEGSTE